MDNRDTNSWEYLVAQYLANRISREELALLLEKAEREEDMEALTAVLQARWDAAAIAAGEETADRNWDEKFAAMIAATPELPRRRYFRPAARLAAAAGLALLLGIGSYFIFLKKSPEAPASISINRNYDRLPGTNGGVLILANGEQIQLDSAGNGVLAVQGSTKVINRQGRITYSNASGEDATRLFNTITTPRSKQFQLVLADGTRVWLNAASSVRFPAAFSHEERRVEVTGEAYFEVAAVSHKGRKVPFTVHVSNMDIQVLGTHFNVNAYTDENSVNTTLLEGSVLIAKGNSRQLLKPGERAQLDPSDKLTIYKNVDTEAVTAWKNGYFSFDQTDLPAVMRQISRWYDVDIKYEGPVPDRRFGGEISRNTKVSEVLKILEESKIHFRIEEKRIVVLP
ncbi:FecR family protein [Chitinophaga sp. Mgbs1]|uniref:FecR family protein n=1 Tax=Chitinophaga solisilvae TaxID=1233460 RepID=A0A3S1B046_9BACT|nr:FecR family protein [Chitinophaga solisilvae]